MVKFGTGSRGMSFLLGGAVDGNEDPFTAGLVTRLLADCSELPSKLRFRAEDLKSCSGMVGTVEDV